MPGPSLAVRPSFASPLVITDHPGAAQLNQQLRDLFLSRQAEGERYRKKDKTKTLQVEIFESEFDLFTWPDEPVRKLRDFCAEMILHTVQQLNDYTREEIMEMRIVWDSWFHITQFGGYISGHTHPNASWSGVYCVDPGELVPERPDSGVLRFLDARIQYSQYLDLGNARLRSPYGSDTVNFLLTPGKLVLFPSYMIHETGPYFGSAPRITVSFNCSFVHASMLATRQPYSISKS